ncbi:DUF6293 family protein [Oxyplasma meridianum]|uniref:DUF6293 family protein n=1 Tax=Oxyplasma meridianum TaxID=3073602 RepID=A0AAX4NFT9_9ARCH
MRYAIAISGFHPELVIKPFLRMTKTIDELVLLGTRNEKSMETTKKIGEFLAFANVRSRYIEIQDIFNFFEILANLENLIVNMGKPLWVNVSAGPGIAISALTFFAINHDVIVVFYNKENDKTTKVEISKAKDLFRNASKNYDLLKLIEKTPLTLSDIAEKLTLSKSTISRRVRILKANYLVEINKKDRRISIGMTNTSRKLLERKE